MYSLNNAIKLYKQEEKFMIVTVIDNMLIPIHNREDQIDFYDYLEIAEIDRIYYQSDIAETLKVIKL